MSDTLLPVSGVEFCPTWMLWENDALRDETGYDGSEVRTGSRPTPPPHRGPGGQGYSLPNVLPPRHLALD